MLLKAVEILEVGSWRKLVPSRQPQAKPEASWALTERAREEDDRRVRITSENGLENDPSKELKYKIRLWGTFIISCQNQLAMSRA